MNGAQNTRKNGERRDRSTVPDVHLHVFIVAAQWVTFQVQVLDRPHLERIQLVSIYQLATTTAWNHWHGPSTSAGLTHVHYSLKTECLCYAYFTPRTPTRQDKTVLSCRCPWCEVNWRQVKTENFETVSSSLEMRCELSLALSWPSFQFAMWLPIVSDVIFGNWVKTSSQMCSYRRRDWTKLLSPIYWKLSATVTNSVQSCLVSVGGVN